MKISALIKKLERLQDQNGDIDLVTIVRNQKGRQEIIGFNPDIRFKSADVRIPVIQRGGWFVEI